MVNYNHAYLESLVKLGSTRLSILLVIVKSLVSLVQPWFTRLTRLLTRLLGKGKQPFSTIYSESYPPRLVAFFSSIFNKMLETISTLGICRENE